MKNIRDEIVDKIFNGIFLHLSQNIDTRIGQSAKLNNIYAINTYIRGFLYVGIEKPISEIFFDQIWAP